MNINNFLIQSGFTLLGYLIGAIRTGFFIARFKGIENIALHGSGSSGATNVGRILGPFYFLIVFYIDYAKAFLYLFLLNKFGFEFQIIIAAASALILGNTSAFFMHPRGKGVATALGIISFFSFKVVFFMLLIWILVFFLTRTVGIASIIALFFLPLVTFVCMPFNGSLFLLIIIIMISVSYRHIDNVRKYFLIC